LPILTDHCSIDCRFKSKHSFILQHEYCESPDDFLERRTRIAFLDAKAAVDAVPRVAEIMATQLGWSDERREDEVRKAVGSLGGSFFSAAK